MVETTNLRHPDNSPELQRLHWPWVRRILAQRQMRSETVVVVAVETKRSSQRRFVDHDCMIETLAPKRADNSLDSIAIPQQVAWRGVPGKRVNQLLSRPLRLEGRSGFEAGQDGGEQGYTEVAHAI